MHDPEPDGPALRERLEAVRRRVAAAAARSGRDASAVTLVAVTKTVGPRTVLALARLGQRDFGENRPLDLVAKRAAVESAAGSAVGGVPPLRWHMIGHVQRRKVRPALAASDVIHSLDSLALAAAVSAEAQRAGRGAVPVLVQVNVSGEATKGGFAPADLGEALRRAGAEPGLDVRGLMTMAPEVEDPEDARAVFRGLRELRDWAAASGYLRGLELSMGMSEDFDVAVEEGATIVRVGRALVGNSLAPRDETPAGA